MRKMIFTFSFPVTLTFDFRPQICSPIVTLVQRCFQKLEVSTTFPFPGKLDARDGRTDGGVQRLMRLPIEKGRIIGYRVELWLMLSRSDVGTLYDLLMTEETVETIVML